MAGLPRSTPDPGPRPRPSIPSRLIQFVSVEIQVIGCRFHVASRNGRQPIKHRLLRGLQGTTSSEPLKVSRSFVDAFTGDSRFPSFELLDRPPAASGSNSRPEAGPRAPHRRGLTNRSARVTHLSAPDQCQMSPGGTGGPWLRFTTARPCRWGLSGYVPNGWRPRL